MTLDERELLNKWLEDPSFINWSKESNSKDTTKWENYFNNNHQYWELAKMGRLLVLGIPFHKAESEKTNALKSSERFLERLEQKINTANEGEKLTKLQKKMLGVLALLCFAIIIAIFFYIKFYQNNTVFLATKYGQQLEHILPDGSDVVLNANSSLEYNSKNSRKVYLQGEAFFNVKKKPKTKENFKVFTDDLEVIVLGTSFNVNSRNDQTKVFLEEGKIDLKVEDEEKRIIEMIPGDLVTYSKKNSELKESKDKESPLQNSSWRGGVLIFKEMYLSEALFEIEDIYGIQFVIESESLRKEKIRGGVPINDLKVTLLTLNEIYSIKVRQHGKRYFLTKTTN